MTRRPCTGCGLIRCSGDCYLAEPADQDEDGKTLDQLIAENPELKAYRDEIRASLWGIETRSDPFRSVA